MNMHMPAPGPLPGGAPAAGQFRSPTLSPRSNRPDTTPPHVVSSPLVGPSRRSQLAFPSFEPVHIGSAPIASKAPSYVGAPPGRSSPGVQPAQDAWQSPRIVPEPRWSSGAPQPEARRSSAQQPEPRWSSAAQQLQRQPASVHSSAQSLKAPLSGAAGTGCQAPRISVPGAPGGLATAQLSEEHCFAPSFTPRVGQPPPPVGGNTGVPRRTYGGSQPLQPHRQFGSNVSPRVAPKPGHVTADHSAAAKLDFGDKENCENLFQRDHVTAMKLQDPCAANSEHLAMAFAEHSARLGKREQETAEQELQKQRELQQLQMQEEQRLHREELGRLEKHKEELAWRSCEERNILLDRLGKLEAQNAEFTRSLTQLTQEKQAELDDKDRILERLHSAECELHSKESKDVQLQELKRVMDVKDVQLQELKRVMHEKEQQWAGFHEVECLMHDKDQTLQQMKHEHQKQEAVMKAQIHDLQTELQALRHRKHEDSDVAERQAASDRHQQEKEVRALWQKVHDQKSTIKDQESRFQRTWSAGSFITPGDFMRLVKSSEASNGFSVTNARQLSRITELESLQALHEKEIDLHCRHLPAEVINADKQEAIECAIAQSEYTSGNDLTRPEPCDEPQDVE